MELDPGRINNIDNIKKILKRKVEAKNLNENAAAAIR